GVSVALNGDGGTLAVGAFGEDSNTTSIGGNQSDNGAFGSGAVYVYTRDGLGAWSQQEYVKASNTDGGDEFGYSVALSGDGSTLAVGAHEEDSNATGVGGNPADNSALNSGAVYIYTRDGLGAWSQQAYVKASNTGGSDYFGWSVALSEDGSTLAVGANLEGSNATGVGGNQADNSAGSSGAAYVYTRDGLGAWSHQAYIKASNTGESYRFGHSVALSGDGNILAVGADVEPSNATDIGGNQSDVSAPNSGAVYLY
ncbi:MAG: integrin, partial [Cytophagales bacterium]|nr:integrin [Cytophagales bacterium]